MSGILVYININSIGLTNYSISFSTYLINTTLGNFTTGVFKNIDIYLVTIIPCAIYLIYFIFSLVWTAHYKGCISEEDENQ